MTEIPDRPPSGYWWQCRTDSTHHASTDRARGIKLTAFMFALAEHNWNQQFLVTPCIACDGVMDLTYEFPRKVAPSRLRVIHIVGPNDYVEEFGYLPMLWKAQSTDAGAPPWFDFKYVGRSDRGHLQAYGLARPAVWSRDDLTKLFTLYRNATGETLGS